MRRLTVPLFAVLCLFATQVQADFTFPTVNGDLFGNPFNVVAGTGVNINFNDVANAAGVTADTYGSFELTVDWTAGGGDPWSNEARVSVTTAGGTAGPLAASAGAGTNGDPTTLTFTGDLFATYDPSVDGSLDLFINQTFAGSDANWGNLSLTLISGTVDPPVTEATITTPAINTTNSYDDATYGAGEVTWVLFQHDGQTRDIIIDTFGTALDGNSDTEIGLYDDVGNLIATNDDFGGALQSSMTFTDLAAGDYYIAATTFNAAFGAGWNVTTTGTQSGSLVVNVSAVPEPSSIALIGLLGMGLAYRRRR